jgi:hypothetical protein
MKRAFNTLESVLNKKHEEDEYDLYGRILANKLRKLPENERELFMYDIDGMFVQRYHRLNNPLLSSLQPTFSANKSSSTVTSFSDSPSQPLSILIPEQPLTTNSTYSNSNTLSNTSNQLTVSNSHIQNIVDTTYYTTVGNYEESNNQ